MADEENEAAQSIATEGVAHVEQSVSRMMTQQAAAIGGVDDGYPHLSPPADDLCELVGFCFCASPSFFAKGMVYGNPVQV